MTRSVFALAALCIVPAASAKTRTPAWTLPAVSTSVAVSSATLAEPGAIDGLKRLIEADQKEILRARAAYKRAKARVARHPAEAAKTEETWRQAREKLKADRRLLRRAIELNDAERSKKRGP